MMTTEEREKFLADRLTGIGGSDAAVVLGLSQYKTPWQLWLEKTQQIAAEDLSENSAVQWGIRMEPVVTEWFVEKTGHSVIAHPEMARHAEHEFMIANVDGILEDEPAGFEAKTAGAYSRDKWGDEGSDFVPTEYLIQCQHYMGVTGLPKWYLAVLLGGNEPRIYTLNRDDELIASIIEAEAAFWEHVVTRTPVQPDFAHPSTEKVIKALYPGVEDRVVELPDSLLVAAREFEAQKAIKKNAEEEAAAYKTRILFALGTAGAGVFADGTGYKRSFVKGSTFTVTRDPSYQLRFQKEIK